MQELSDHDKHKFDIYIKALANTNLILLFCVLVNVIGITLSIIFDNWLWFSRFGSLTTVAGLLLTMSPIFSKGIYISHSGAGRWATEDEHGKTMITTPEERAVGNSVLIGIIITIYGTVVWGFGDLVI